MAVTPVARNFITELTSTTGAFRTNVSRLQSGALQIGALGGQNIRVARGFDTQINAINSAATGIVQGLRTADAAKTGLDKAKDLLTEARTIARDLSDPASTTNRTTAQARLDAITTELNTNAADTMVDGQSLLNGSRTSVTVSSGTNSQQTSVRLIDARASTLGVNGASVATSTAAADAATRYDRALARVQGATSSVTSTRTRLEAAANTLEQRTDATATQQDRLTTAASATQAAQSLFAQVSTQSSIALFAQGNVSSGSFLRLFGIG